MAIAPNGTKQKTYYVREDLAKVIAHVASDEDKRESDVVNDAFDYYINIKLSEEQRRVFGYKKEQQNGHQGQANGRRSIGTGGVLQGAGGGSSDEGGTSGSPPGRKKRAGKEDEARRRNAK